MNNSIRYDVSLGMRLLRAIPVIGFYFFLAFCIYIFLPESAREIPLQSIVVLGFIGMWRYLWLITHCVRAGLYEYLVYPRMQHQASKLPEAEKYPPQMFFLIPTYKERPEVTRSMLDSVITESAQIPSEVVVIVNAGAEDEDELFRQVHANHPYRDSVRLEFIRQEGGKRQGMADCLYNLSQREIGENDVIALMDGDTVLGAGILETCLPLFAVRKSIDALTTDNIAVTEGNWLYRKWYTCLLYTSPSPRDQRGSRMPSSA